MLKPDRPDLSSSFTIRRPKPQRIRLMKIKIKNMWVDYYREITALVQLVMTIIMHSLKIVVSREKMIDDNKMKE
jgi:hypothetical protein